MFRSMGSIRFFIVFTQKLTHFENSSMLQQQKAPIPTKRVIGLKTLCKLKRKHPLKRSKKLFSPLSRFIDPYTFHRFFSDIIIPDKLPLSNYCNFLSFNRLLAPTKHVHSLLSNNLYFEMTIMEKKSLKTLPIGFLAYRLRSLGSADAFLLAEALEQFVRVFYLVELFRTKGNNKLFLDNFEMNSIKMILEYFKNIHKNAKQEEDGKEFIMDWMKLHKDDLCFYFQYDNFKGEVGGAQLEKIGVNHPFRKILNCKPLEMLERSPFLVPVSDFYKTCTMLIKIMINHNYITEEIFFVKTKLGIKKIKFNAEKLYFYDSSAQLKIVSLFYADQNELDDDLKQLSRSEEVEKKKSLANNETWGKITKLYYEKLNDR